MTRKEQSELRRLHKKVMSGKATCQEVLRAIDLRNKLRLPEEES